MVKGGKLLEDLRIQRKWSLQKVADQMVELYNSGDVSHLSRIENGRIRLPDSDTVDRYLRVLNATPEERGMVFRAYGYQVRYPFPTAIESQQAKFACVPSINAWLAPAYLVDPWHQLMHWNHAVPRLLGRSQASMCHLEGVSLIEVIFNPIHKVLDRFADQSAAIPLLIQLLYHESTRYQDEPWYRERFDGAYADIPYFAQAWDQWTSESMVAQRATQSVRFRNNEHILSFHFLIERWAKDDRFRTIYYIADDEYTHQTMRHWQEQAWAEEIHGDPATH